MELLILLPSLPALWLSIRASPGRAFTLVFLPSLLLLPNYYHLTIAGLPKLTFAGAAVVPIAIYYFARSFRWRISVIDGLLTLFFFWICASEVLNQGFSALRYFIVDFATSTALPFLLTRQLIETGNLRLAFVKQILFLLAIVSALDIYEFRLGVNLFRTICDRLFVSQQAVWVTQLRWHFARTSGPFGHAILSGTIMAIGFMLFCWVVSTGEWKGKWLGIPRGKQWLYGAALLAGMMTSMSRGPWMGAVLAMGVAVVGRVRNVKRALRIAALVIGTVGLFGGVAISRYASVGREAAQTDEQETAAYRKELLDHYIPVIMMHPWTGWGMKFPRAAGAESVDNQYLLIALTRGVLGLGMFAAIVGVVLFRLARKSARPDLPRGERIWGFTLLGALLCILISLTTVFLGEQLSTLYWMLIGWAEGWVALPAYRDSGRSAPGPAPGSASGRYVRPLSFAKVIA